MLASILLVAALSLVVPVVSDQVVIVPEDHTVTPLEGKADAIKTALRSSNIIPEVLDDFSPTALLSLTYPSAHNAVSLGNTLPVSNVSSAPIFQIQPLNPTATKTNKTYTVILTDPDATSRADPAMSEMCHWIVTNVTVTAPPVPDTGDSMTELIGYLPPGPPPKTGKHRYVFVLLSCESSDKDKCLSVKKPEDRKHWGYGKPRTGVRKWARENGLAIEGANWFYAQNEEQ